jgi:hypothetical protein
MTTRRKSPRQIAAERDQRAAQLRMEDDVLTAEGLLDPADQTLDARHLREVAASIRDHREMDLRRAEWAVRDAEPTTARLLDDEPRWPYFDNGHWAYRRLRTWRLADGRLAAMLTEEQHDQGVSITNAAEAIAAKLALDFPGETIVQIEHYPDRVGIDDDEHFDGVAIVGGNPTWWPMPPAEVIAMFGTIYETDPDQLNKEDDRG